MQPLQFWAGLKCWANTRYGETQKLCFSQQRNIWVRRLKAVCALCRGKVWAALQSTVVTTVWWTVSYRIRRRRWDLVLCGLLGEAQSVNAGTARSLPSFLCPQHSCASIRLFFLPTAKKRAMEALGLPSLKEGPDSLWSFIIEVSISH